MTSIGKDIIKGGKMIHCFLRSVLPLVNKEIDGWQSFAAANIPDEELRKQAFASIKAKRFHCQGGSFYSIYPGVNTDEFIPFIVALQTISDYLDNLCDRASVLDPQAFAQLHCAMTDALDPFATHKDYYAHYPFKADGNYLNALVDTCQAVLRRLPSYPLVKQEMLTLATLYCQLQTHKHIDLKQRETAMLVWLHDVNTNHNLSPWEFAAATGSTLGMFMLAAAAYQQDLTAKKVKTITTAYFPWICGLHIQLDYFIDQIEDQENNDLNFISYYHDDNETGERLTLFFNQAFKHAALMPNSFFSKTIVRGLMALYLSDTKHKTPAQKHIQTRLLNNAGFFTNVIYQLCCFLRKKHIV